MSQKSWDVFYKHNQDKFFKNRNYLSFAFDVIDTHLKEKELGVLWEVGCGTGNTVVPLREKYPQMSYFACDFSPNAIKLLSDLGVCNAFVKDMVADEVTEVPDNHVDFTTMIFFLSAIHPDEHQKVLLKIGSKMKLGGCILFRDYAAYDLAMIRFINKRKGILDLERMIFKRGDNTLACFFEDACFTELMAKCGFEKVRSEYCTVESKNVKRGLVMRRAFLNAIFRKL